MPLISREKDQELSTEMTDGKVTWVNQRGRVVWLNFGLDDGLRRQISFSVIAPEENNPLKAEKKGSDRSHARAGRPPGRSADHGRRPSEPDHARRRLFSAAWRPGHPEHFALVGLMDLDKDGFSDLQKIREHHHGQRRRHRRRAEGRRHARRQLAVETRYLVLGKEPDREEQANRLLKLFQDD